MQRGGIGSTNREDDWLPFFFFDSRTSFLSDGANIVLFRRSSPVPAVGEGVKVQFHTGRRNDPPMNVFFANGVRSSTWARMRRPAKAVDLPREPCYTMRT